MNYQIIQVNLYKCEGVGCKSDAEIDDIVNTHNIDIEVISTYFDFNNYDNPIQHFLQDLNIVALTPNLSQYVNYYVRENTATLNDNIFLGSQAGSEVHTFYSIGKKEYMNANFKIENSYF